MISESSLSKVDQFFRKYKLLKHNKRDMILHADDTTSSVFFIKKGYIRVYRISEQGEELTLSILKPHDFFPLTYGFNISANPYYLEAITELEFWRAPKEEFLSYIKKDPSLYMELTTRLLVRLDGVMTRMEYLLFSNAYTKVATTLLVCAKRFGTEQDGRTLILVPLTHRDIATMVGLTRETTSLEMKKLEKDGFVIKMGRNLALQNIKGLERQIMLREGDDSSFNYSL
jgi:CRP-like cAMP-binding protein